MYTSNPHKTNRLTLRVLAVTLVVLLSGTAFMPGPVLAAEAQKKTAAKKAAPAKKTPAKTKTTSSTKMRGSGEVKKEKQRTEREIAETKKKITDNEKKISGQLDRLSSIDSQIERQESTIDELTAVVERLTLRSDMIRDSIALLRAGDSLLSRQVADGLRRRHVERARVSSLPFVMAASGLSEARQRINYLNAMQTAKTRQVNALRDRRRLLEDKRAALDSVLVQHSAAVKQLTTAREILAGRRRESQRVVADLRNEGASLKKVLEQKNRRIRQLDEELDRIIAEEQRRAAQASKGSSAGKGKTASGGKTSAQQGNADASRKLTGSFAANKGRLLFPVAGRYTIVGTFGRARHSELSHVQVDNSGIDISVPSGTKARAVFDGTVSSVFFMDGYENIVIVRHGDYLTVYAGLSSISVAKGTKVKAGQNIGTVGTSDGKTILHFEVRKERTKLNPLQWVK